MSPGKALSGNGLLLFLRVDDFALTLQRARALVSKLDEEPHVNPRTETKEFSLRDPDGYYVAISALSAAWLQSPGDCGSVRDRIVWLVEEFADSEADQLRSALECAMSRSRHDEQLPVRQSSKYLGSLFD